MTSQPRPHPTQPLFQFTRPAWGATRFLYGHGNGWEFQFTRPAWGATPRIIRGNTSRLFQFTRPAWGATKNFGCGSIALAFQFTRPAWGATGSLRIRAPAGTFIHAPRVGRDLHESESRKIAREVSFTRPAGARRRRFLRPTGGGCFNSRAPRGARHPASRSNRASYRVSIHAPRVGRDQKDDAKAARRAVSIHAPRVGRDLIEYARTRDDGFQFTRPAWGATQR